jgi:hypothetical protein
MMNKHLRLGAVALLGAGLFVSACNKNNDSGPTNTPKEMKLAGHAWSVTAATFTDSTTTDSSFYAACMQDDSLAFSLNHQFNLAGGTEVCDSSLLPYGNGIWAFNTAEDSLALKNNAGTQIWQVKTLTDSTFQVSYADSLDHKVGTKTLSFAAKQ